MSQMSVVIDAVEWFLARKDFEQCHFSWENFPYASPRGFSGQLSDMLYAEITWILSAAAFHLLWHIIWTMEMASMGLALGLRYFYRCRVCHAPITNNQQDCYGVCCMSMTGYKVGMWEDLWQRESHPYNPYILTILTSLQGTLLNGRVLSLVGHQLLCQWDVWVRRWNALDKV